MNDFGDLLNPNGIHFLKFVDEYLAGCDRTTCGCITNGGIDVDYYEGVSKINKNCRGTLCAKCIFFHLNADKRLEYFKSIQQKSDQS